MIDRAALSTFFYNAGVSFLFTHELDAMLRSEWRMLFVLGELPDDTAAAWFVFLHLPVFLLVLYLGNSNRSVLRLSFRRAISAFLVIHGGLHLHLAEDARNEFTGLLSALYIALAAACGLAYLLCWWRGNEERRDESHG
ncbi:MAG: DUF6713 family protein [Pseudomonadota bacterium]